jgi:beta-glucosidase
VRIVHSSGHVDLALRAAREGIVLLKNDKKILPIKKNLKSIAVIGPNADSGRDQLGDYSPYRVITDIVTVLEGIKGKVSSGTKVTSVRGCDWLDGKGDEIGKAVDIAKKAELAVVVVGEGADSDGEGKDVASLDLTGSQEELVRAVYGTGTPTVVVLINGRPLSIRWIAENIPAVIEAWNCGERGGEAVADVLFGDYNPSGRLPITVPRHAGQLPVYYNHTATKETKMKSGYVDMSARPLYPFGHGLSYTEFTYGGLKIEPLEIRPGGEVRVSAEVENTGPLAGEEVVQLYLNDVLSSVSTPVKNLRGFEKVKLSPGGKQTVSFVLTPEHLSLLDRNVKRIVEPGRFEIMIGHSSDDIKLRGSFTVID